MFLIGNFDSVLEFGGGYWTHLKYVNWNQGLIQYGHGTKRRGIEDVRALTLV